MPPGVEPLLTLLSGVPGGTRDRRTLGLAISAAQRGWRVVVVAPEDPEDPDPRPLRIGGVEVRTVGSPVATALPRGARQRLVEWLQYPSAHAGREAARLLAARRRVASARAAGHAAGSAGALARAGDLAAGLGLSAATLLHRQRWRGTRSSGGLHRSLGPARAQQHALGLVLDLGTAVEELRPVAVLAADAVTLPAAASAALRLRAHGNDCLLVADVRRDLGGALSSIDREWARWESRWAPAVDLVSAPDPYLVQAFCARYGPRPTAVVADGAWPGRPGAAEPARSRTAASDSDTVLVVLDGADRSTAAQAAGVAEACAAVPGLHVVWLASHSTPSLRAARDRAWARGAGARFTVLPTPPRDGFREALAGAGAAVVLARPGSGGVPWDYAAAVDAGVPVLAGAGPGLRDAVRRDGTGVVADLADPVAATAALHDLLGSRDVLAERARRARATPWDAAPLLDALARSIGRAAPRPPGGRGSVSDLEARRAGPAPETRSLGIGPANFAGQGWAWGRAAAAAVPGLRTEVFAVEQGVLTFPVDRRIRRRDLRALSWQLDQQRRVLSGFTHLLAEANRPLFGYLNGEDLLADLPTVERAGIRVGVALHGSEVRDPDRHRQREPLSPFRLVPGDQEGADWLAAVTAFVRRTERLLEEFDGPVFAATPDLLADVPRAVWLPVVVDVPAETGAAPLLVDVPLVLHVPSRSRLKGSDAVDAAVGPLVTSGRIRYQRLQGVPPGAVPGLLADADVVLDQFALGSYGVLACEAMAAGRVVVGHVRDDVRRRVGVELPIVQATPQDLAEVLDGLLADRDAARVMAGRGRRFVREVHDGRRSGEVLRQYLLSAPG